MFIRRLDRSGRIFTELQQYSTRKLAVSEIVRYRVSSHLTCPTDDDAQACTTARHIAQSHRSRLTVSPEGDRVPRAVAEHCRAAVADLSKEPRCSMSRERAVRWTLAWLTHDAW